MYWLRMIRDWHPLILVPLTSVGIWIIWYRDLFDFNRLTSLTPILFLVLSLVYTAYWHAARSDPSHGACLANLDKNRQRARIYVRVCGGILLALLAAAVLNSLNGSYNGNDLWLKITATVDLLALAGLSGMILLYIVGKGVQ